MSKRRTWIKIKRGLLEPKHREKLGPAVWLYVYILDRADWEQGAVLEWKDKNAADEMEMEISTVRAHRQRLESEGYIRTEQKQYHLKLYVLKWTNPREYSGQIYNQQGIANTAPSNIQGIPQGVVQGVPQGPSKDSTPTSNSQNHTSHITEKLTTKAAAPIDTQLHEFLAALQDREGNSIAEGVLDILVKQHAGRLDNVRLAVEKWRSKSGNGIGLLVRILQAGKLPKTDAEERQKYYDPKGDFYE